MELKELDKESLSPGISNDFLMESSNFVTDSLRSPYLEGVASFFNSSTDSGKGNHSLSCFNKTSFLPKDSCLGVSIFFNLSTEIHSLSCFTKTSFVPKTGIENFRLSRNMRTEGAKSLSLFHN